MRHIITSLILFILITPLIYAQNIDRTKDCIEKIFSLNISCNKCIAVIPIIKPYNFETNIVGDTFTYDLILINMNESIDKASFSVNLTNPNREQIGFKLFENISLNNKYENYTLHPTYLGRPHEVDIFFFDTAGSYRISMKTSSQIEFFRFSEETCSYNRNPSEFRFYFEAVSQFDSEFKNELKNQLESSKFILEDLRSLISQIDIAGKQLYNLTLVLSVLTVANISIVYYYHKKNLFKTILVFLFWLIVALLILTYLDYQLFIT